jgi:sortase A
MRGAARLLERCLWAIGFVAAGVWLAIWLNARWWQMQGSRELDRRISETHSSSLSSPSASSPTPAAPPARLAQGDLIGRIEIPRLNVSSVIFEGDDDGVLTLGVGHLPASPLPGETGNVVLAAHRDTFFRALRHIRDGDRIDLVTPAGTRRYRVDLTSIVTPDHTEVLAPTPIPTLTLVTCYPFDWFGHAPKRFIVRARAFDPPTPAKSNLSGVTSAVHLQPPHVAARVRHKPTVRRHPVSIPVAASEDAASGADSPATTKAAGNWFIRGLKQLNPAPIIAKIGGN